MGFTIDFKVNGKNVIEIIGDCGWGDVYNYKYVREDEGQMTFRGYVNHKPVDGAEVLMGMVLQDIIRVRKTKMKS